MIKRSRRAMDLLEKEEQEAVRKFFRLQKELEKENRVLISKYAR